MFCVLLSLFLKLLFLKAILWVPEIRGDSPRRSMHGLFHSRRFNFDKLNAPLEPGVGALRNKIVLERKG